MNKIFVFLVSLVISAITYADNNNTEEVKIMNSKRSLLMEVREGDYIHPGDTEAIDFVLKKITKINSLKFGNTLDVGSSYGGTAHYLFKKGFKKIWGIDIDSNSVEYATEKYSNIKFMNIDALDVTRNFRKNFFNFICMFNSIYAIEDKGLLLKNLATIAKRGAILVVFDYSKIQGLQESFDKKHKSKKSTMKDLAGKDMNLLDIDSFYKNLGTAHWKLLDSIDITAEYIEWYEDFLAKIKDRRPKLQNKYDVHDIDAVENLFSKILYKLKNKELGGRLIIAEKI